MVPSRWRFWPVRDSRNGELGSPPPCTTRQVARRRVLYRDTNTVMGTQPVPERGTGHRYPADLSDIGSFEGKGRAGRFAQWTLNISW